MQADVVWSTWGQRPAEAGKLYGKLSGNSDHQAQSAHKGAQFASNGAQGAPFREVPWETLRNSVNTWMRHWVDSRETLGELGPPWSGDLLAGGSTGQNILGTDVHT